jgi:hypothetical protein
MTSSVPDLRSSSASDTSNILSDLKAKLWSEPENKQLPLIQTAADLGEPGLELLMEFLLAQRSSLLATGKAYQILLQSNSDKAREFLHQQFPNGVVPLASERNIDYAPLQQLLAEQDFEAADRLTLQKLCELAGESAIQRKWLYFTEVANFPDADLRTIDALWQVHSEGKFGFSVQREIWLSLAKNWDKFWVKIAWKNGNNWTRYPQEFTWDLSAPKGHLPLSNQLRGVRVIASLFNHPVWTR